MFLRAGGKVPEPCRPEKQNIQQTIYERDTPFI